MNAEVTAWPRCVNVGRPELAIVAEHLERLLETRRLDPGENHPQDRIANRRCVPHVKIDWIKPIAQVKFGIVVQGAAVKPLIAAGDAPTDQVAECVMIHMQVERDGIIKSKILGMHRLALQKTRTESDDLSALTPDKKPILV